jgi:HlyD family secretion protein
MKPRSWAIAGSIVAAAAALLAWAFAPRPVAVELASAAVGRFEAAVEEDAKTRLVDRYVISAPVAGRLARVTLREGDAVAAGAVVAQLMPQLPQLLDERTRREFAARFEAAEAQVQRAGARAERARLALEQANLDLQRSEKLARDGFIAPTKLESDRIGVRSARRELEAATEERHIAEHERQQARAALGAARGGADARSFVVTTPVAGKVLRVLQTSETNVAAGTPLLEVGDPARLEIVAQLLTTDALQAKPGTPVRIERWGGSGVLEGQVQRVEPAAFTKVSALGVEEQRVNVIITITSPREQWVALGDGFRVVTRVITISADHALKVPASAVFPLVENAGGSHGVFVVDGGRARLVPVVLAERNGGEAWLRSGIEAGARVIVYPPPVVRDGVRVAERGR